MINLEWGYIAIAITTLAYLIVAFIQFRRASLIHSRVKKHVKHGKKVPAKILSYARKQYVGVEFTNLSNSKVLAYFHIHKNEKRIPIGSEAAVFLSSKSSDNPALVLEYNKRPIITNVSKYMLFGFILLIIVALLLVTLYLTKDREISQYAGLIIPVIAGLGIFIGVTEDDMAQNRVRNKLLLYGFNATAAIRTINATGIVKEGYKQVSFFVEYTDKNGVKHFGKADEPIDLKDYKRLREQKMVDILYSPDSRKGRCLLNYSWE